MTVEELIKKLTVWKFEMVAPFEVATTKEQWEKLLPKEKFETETEVANYYLSMLPVFKKTAAKITFPDLFFNENELFFVIEEITKGFDKQRCLKLLKVLTPYKEKLSTVCDLYYKTWGKPAPIVFVCDLLSNKTSDEQLPGATAQPDIMTDRAKTYFKKAIQAGFMEKTESGYKWTFEGRKGARAALSYFIMKIYSPDPKDKKTIPFRAMENLFGVKRLDSALRAALETVKPQAWRQMIDGLFNDVEQHTGATPDLLSSPGCMG